ncbi:MAG: OB-fold domain-containing protein, partial [Candidatus Alcyoniella australis]|nr:OB-fold domain-containing protein [Candidatus Alcyoniella australis]
MIRTIRGKLTYKSPDYVILDVNGLGYRLYLPFSSFSALGEVGEQVGLLVHTVVREDAFDLYGFVSEIERRMFELLISV